MSWVVEIVSGDVAPEDDAAWEYLEELRDQDDLRDERPKPSSEMLELYHRLTARYPCITEDPNSPWADGPLINDFGDQLTAVGVVTSGMAEALPFIIETATGMGFTVFDGGDEAIHRPKGWTPPIVWPVPERAPLRPWWKFW